MSSGWSCQGGESVEVVSMFAEAARYPEKMSVHLEERWNNIKHVLMMFSLKRVDCARHDQISILIPFL